MINLSKGQKINLAKGTTGIKELFFGANWGMKESGGFLGFGKSRKAVDLDASVFLLDESGNTVERVYFGHRKTNGVLHSGDDLVGDSSRNDDDNEIISVKLDALKPQVKSLIFTLNSFSGDNFGGLPYAGIRIYEGAPNQPTAVKASFNLADDGTFSGAKSVVVGKAYLHNGNWNFEAIGDTYRHQYLRELEMELKRYM